MNIIYISNLSGNKSVGLTYSVPEQIKSQSKIDNVLWYNLNPNYENEHQISVYYSTTEIPKFEVENLPAPFNCPDLVIFEGFYFIEYCKIAKKLFNNKIPYIIIPRSSLTREGQSKKKFKKMLANYFHFYQFAKNAAAIQYLSDEEHKSSGNKWNRSVLIIPNGIHEKERRKSFKKESTSKRGIFVGRLDIYQKGIDLLLEACHLIKDELKNSNYSIDLFGPDQNGSRREIEMLIKKYNLTDIVTVNEAIYGDAKEKKMLESDFFVLTSRFEGLPMGLIEALAYGLPCLVTQGSNMLNEITDYNAGWGARTDVPSIVESIRLMLRENTVFDEKGLNAYYLSTNYKWDKLAETSRDKYKEILSKK